MSESIVTSGHLIGGRKECDDCDAKIGVEASQHQTESVVGRRGRQRGARSSARHRPSRQPPSEAVPTAGLQAWLEPLPPGPCLGNEPTKQRSSRRGAGQSAYPPGLEHGQQRRRDFYQGEQPSHRVWQKAPSHRSGISVGEVAALEWHKRQLEWQVEEQQQLLQVFQVQNHLQREQMQSLLALHLEMCAKTQSPAYLPMPFVSEACEPPPAQDPQTSAALPSTSGVVMMQPSSLPRIPSQENVQQLPSRLYSPSPNEPHESHEFAGTASWDTLDMDDARARLDALEAEVATTEKVDISPGATEPSTSNNLKEKIPPELHIRCKAGSYVVDEEGYFVLPSIGSKKHLLDTCRPCHYFASKAGCGSGEQCQYCHCKHSKRSRPKLTVAERAECQRLAQNIFDCDKRPLEELIVAEEEFLTFTSDDLRLASYATQVLRSLRGGGRLTQLKHRMAKVAVSQGDDEPQQEHAYDTGSEETQHGGGQAMLFESGLGFDENKPWSELMP